MVEYRDGKFVLVIGEQQFALSRAEVHDLIASANEALRESIVEVRRLR